MSNPKIIEEYYAHPLKGRLRIIPAQMAISFKPLQCLLVSYYNCFELWKREISCFKLYQLLFLKNIDYYKNPNKREKQEQKNIDFLH